MIQDHLWYKAGRVICLGCMSEGSGRDGVEEGETKAKVGQVSRG